MFLVVLCGWKFFTVNCLVRLVISDLSRGVREPGKTWGGRGTGDGRRKTRKGGEAGSQQGREAGEKFKKESLCYLFTAYDPLKNMKPLTFF